MISLSLSLNIVIVHEESEVITKCSEGNICVFIAKYLREDRNLKAPLQLMFYKEFESSDSEEGIS
jgi:hypothetical protein